VLVLLSFLDESHEAPGRLESFCDITGRWMRPGRFASVSGGM
jgi:hypothetical protein